MFEHSFVKLAVAFLAVVFFAQKLVTHVQRRRFARARGCQPPARLPQSERIIGLQAFKIMSDNMKNHIMLPSTVEQHKELGNTFSIVIPGQTAISTIEPENLKAVLATQFHDFGIGKRHRGMGALLGHGIFTSDGAHWERSRVWGPTSWS
jgi:hypothetical protein